ncbi:hypothetical protein [Lignipirellula cremea]|uniref:Uncharacterized protein n=1 Tax=Lignipirellula cremea TaxID=2528010 RepID=A0A518DLW5_9BACT|nr:hypothetical protein [Lignipirellula cremea]QDU92838.1 hypothetical protein Pla8534_06110 [Lignipirellula cremea]
MSQQTEVYYFLDTDKAAVCEFLRNANIQGFVLPTSGRLTPAVLKGEALGACNLAVTSHPDFRVVYVWSAEDFAWGFLLIEGGSEQCRADFELEKGSSPVNSNIIAAIIDFFENPQNGSQDVRQVLEWGRNDVSAFDLAKRFTEFFNLHPFDYLYFPRLIQESKRARKAPLGFTPVNLPRVREQSLASLLKKMPRISSEEPAQDSCLLGAWLLYRYNGDTIDLPEDIWAFGSQEYSIPTYPKDNATPYQVDKNREIPSISFPSIKAHGIYRCDQSTLILTWCYLPRPLPSLLGSFSSTEPLHFTLYFRRISLG